MVVVGVQLRLLFNCTKYGNKIKTGGFYLFFQFHFCTLPRPAYYSLVAQVRNQNEMEKCKKTNSKTKGKLKSLAALNELLKSAVTSANIFSNSITQNVRRKKQR